MATRPVHIPKPGYTGDAYCGATRRRGVEFRLTHRPATCKTCIAREPVERPALIAKAAVTHADIQLDDQREALAKVFDAALTDTLAGAETLDGLISRLQGAEFALAFRQVVLAANALHVARANPLAAEAR